MQLTRDSVNSQNVAIRGNDWMLFKLVAPVVNQFRLVTRIIIIHFFA